MSKSAKTTINIDDAFLTLSCGTVVCVNMMVVRKFEDLREFDIFGLKKDFLGVFGGEFRRFCRLFEMASPGAVRALISVDSLDFRSIAGGFLVFAC